MPVITERERLAEVVGQRLEPAEMPRPAIFSQLQPDAFRLSFVEEARNAFGEFGGPDRIVEIAAERQDRRGGAV